MTSRLTMTAIAAMNIRFMLAAFIFRFQYHLYGGAARQRQISKGKLHEEILGRYHRQPLRFARHTVDISCQPDRRKGTLMVRSLLCTEPHGPARQAGACCIQTPACRGAVTD